MKIVITSIFVALAFVASTFAATPADISGKWSLGVDAGAQEVAVGLSLTQKDDTFSGTSISDLGDGTIEAGKIDGTSFTATLKTTLQGQAVDIKLSGKLDGDKMSGTMDVPGFGALPFSGSRTK